MDATREADEVDEVDDAAALTPGWVRWRHAFHRDPELGFAEHRSARRVARLLGAMGLQVVEGVGGTGVVGTLRVGQGARAIALRADMDALALAEDAPQRAYASRRAGCMHACGHDGHMAMLLGAAQLLAARRDFDGTVHFVFQPAEEHGRGARAMLDDGLLQRFPADEIYAAHNIPGLPAGHIATRAGAIMAAEDNFTIRIDGRGGHAARPHMAVDALVIGAEIVLALQTLVSRAVGTLQSAPVAAPAYLERYGAPEHPSDLARHTCIIHDMGPDSTHWIFGGPKGAADVEVTSAFRSNNSLVVRQAALAGYGIALLGDALTIHDIRAGRLYRLLPDYTARKRQAYIVYPSRRHLAQRTRVVIDFMVEEFRRLETRLRDSREWGENESTWLV
ncbi:putative hydrolase YxeP [mine drainage metagenome]|uniref:Putative hydrolase YxeP n=1 Tax=mine drainage metagenome TaxID=410659 RepID=A0A1J5PRC4_9ZZZZ